MATAMSVSAATTARLGGVSVTRPSFRRPFVASRRPVRAAAKLQVLIECMSVPAGMEGPESICMALQIACPSTGYIARRRVQ